MSETKLVRPPQVTAAGWLVVAGSVVVVLMAFSEVAGLRSLETRESVSDYFSRPPLDSLGIGVQAGLDALRITLMVAAACAAATAILGWQVLQRSRGARVAASVLAVPLFLSGLFISGLVGGGMFSAVVVAAIVMLWFQPARDWFDGVARAPLPAPESRPAPDAFRSSTRDPLLDLPPPSAPPLHPTPYAEAPTGHRVVPVQRPAPVVWACVLTWVFSAAAFALMALTFVVMLAAPDSVIEAAHRQDPDLADQGVSDAMLRTTVYVTSVVVLLWSAGAIALGVLTWRRVRWAASALVASAAVAGGLCLLVVVSSFVLALPLVGCVATVLMLLRPEARSWFRR